MKKETILGLFAGINELYCMSQGLMELGLGNNYLNELADSMGEIIATEYDKEYGDLFDFAFNADSFKMDKQLALEFLKR